MYLKQKELLGLVISQSLMPWEGSLYEIVLVYGETIKQVIHEKAGDGIMSAIDFSMHIDKEENPKGDRIKITLDGKFLPHKKW